MGAYLSRPNTEKEAEFGSNSWLKFGASSMQGWRRSQEDAHNCLLDFDHKRSAAYFAVYDGHGGSEVAKYCSLNLPNYILSQPLYSADEINPKELLQKTFVDFDETLVSSKTKSELKSIMNPDGVSSDGLQSDDDEEVAEDADGLEDIEALHDEANKPIESILKQYVEDDNLPDFIQPNEGESCTSDARSSDKITANKENSLCETNISSDASGTRNYNSPDQTTPAMSVDVSDVQTNAKSQDLPAESQSADPGPSSSVGIHDKISEDDEDEDKDYVVGEDVDDDDSDDETDEDEESEEADNDECEEDEDLDDDGEDDDDIDEDAQYDAGQAFLAKSLSYNEPGVDSGSTACVVLILPEIDDNNKERVCLYVANAGDSRAVLCRAKAAVDLSLDHKPEDDLEKARIIAAGGAVTADGRVNDGLNLSRAFGDHGYKGRKDLKLTEQMITAFPDVTCTELLPGHDEFVVIACDGIWNSMTSQEVVDFVYARLHPSVATAGETEENSATHKSSVDCPEVETKSANLDTSSPEYLSEICKSIFDHCLAPNTSGDGTGCDNMTCILVVFQNLEEFAKSAVVRTTSNPLSCLLIDTVADSQTDGLQRKRTESAAISEEMLLPVLGDVESGSERAISGDDVEMSDSCLHPPTQKKPRTESKVPPVLNSLVTPVNGCG